MTSKQKAFVYLALLSILAGDTRGLPYGSSSEDEVASRSDGRIMFPEDDAEDDVEDDELPYIPDSTVPACENSTFCEEVQNYPDAMVQVALRKHKDLKLLSGVDLVTDVVHRGNLHPEDTSLCDSVEKVVYPKLALSKDMQWLFVVNQGEFTQGVRVEICTNENSSCGLIDGFAEGYKTICKQKYIYRQLVAVTTEGQIRPELFRFPASCCCHIKFMDYPFKRFGAYAKKAQLNTSPKGKR